MSAIDISAYQNYPDFAQVKTSPVSLVIMKAGGGEAGSLYTDRVYVTNRAAARAAGLRVGAYFFNGPVDPASAGNYFSGIVDYRPGDVLGLDIENNGTQPAWSPAQALAFVIKVIANLGVAPILYMSSSLSRQDWSALIAVGCKLWVAQYGYNDGNPGNPPAGGAWPAWSMWQYTSMGTVPGISGRVDMSIISPSFASLNETLITNTPIIIPRKKTKMPNAVVDQEQGSVTFNWIAVVTDNGQLHVVDPPNRGWWDALSALYAPVLTAVPTNHAGYNQFVAANQTITGGTFPTADAIAKQVIAALPPVSNGVAPSIADIVAALTPIIPTAVQNAVASRNAIIK